MKNKTLIPIWIMVLVMTSTVFAGVLAVANANVDVKASTETLIDNIGVGEVQIEPLMCDENTCRAWMWKWTSANATLREKYGLGEVSIPARYCSKEGDDGCDEYTDYSKVELTTMRDEAIEVRLDKTADVISARAGTTEKVGSGEVTLS